MTAPRSNLGDSGATPLRGDVAIIGMAGTFPSARNIGEFWRNIVAGRDCIIDVPKERWDPDIFHDPHGDFEDRIYTKKGGYLGVSFAFNPLKYGTMPRAVEAAEPDQFLVLRTVHEAMEDAGYLHREINGERAAFILGRGNYLGAGVGGLLQRGMMTEQTLLIIRAMHPELTPAELVGLKKAIRSRLPGFAPESAPGIIPNIATGRVANRLDLMGPTFTIDAACASSLIATELAVRDLLSKRYDLMIAGGAHTVSEVPFLQVFAAMGALSRSSVIRPFDRDCDGTLAGEGVGIIILKRLEDAERDRDRIYAVVKGVGTSSDGRAKSVAAPRVEGEELALRRAYEMCGLSPDTVTLIEAHGTGTPVGDPTEIEALMRVFARRDGGPRTCAIGSIKSMIGHIMPAAGIAGIIKTALALYHRVLPPTLHCRRPMALLEQQDCPFYVNTQTRPWVHGSAEVPRRAGVNAFGFGGVNAHVVMEEYRPRRPADSPRTSGTVIRSGDATPTFLRDLDTELFVVGADDRAGLRDALLALRDYARTVNGVSLAEVAATVCGSAGGTHRVAIVASSLTDLAAKLTRAADRLLDPKCGQIRDSKGIYYFDEPALRGGKLAFLFPGEGAQYVNMMADLCVHFPEVRSIFDAADQAAAGSRRYPPSADVFPPPFFSEAEAKEAEDRLCTIERATEAVLTADGAMYVLLQRLGVAPDMIVGHSAGEWVAMAAAGVLDFDEFVASSPRLDAVYAGLAADMTIPKAAMLAVGTGRGEVVRLAAEIERTVHIANDNCPHQVVVVCELDDAGPVMKHLQSKGVFVERLPFDRGYHTPVFTYIVEPLRDYFASLRILSPRTTLYSCTTGEKYPAEPDRILDLISQTFARPLVFRDTVERMYADGARVFLEVGPRNMLSGFVNDILRGRPHVAVATNQMRRSGVNAFLNAVAVLAAMHVPMNLAPLFERRGLRKLSLNAAADVPDDPDRAPGTIQLPLACPRLALDEESAWLKKWRKADATAGGRQTGAVGEPSMQQRTGPTFVPPPPMQSTPMPARTPAERSPLPAPAPAAPAAAGMAESLLRQHTQLMGEFLATHEQVIQALLGASSATPGVAATPVSVPVASVAATGATGFVSAMAPARTEPEMAAASALPARVTEPMTAPHASVVKPLSADSPAPPLPRSAPPGLEELLTAIVSEKTGYPPSMLGLDLDLEADLGVDSIKRIEVLGSLQQMRDAVALPDNIDLEAVSKLKTLRQIVNFLNEATGAAGAETPSAAPVPPAPDASALTFAGRVVSFSPDVEVVVDRRIELPEDLYLFDHCFDPRVSECDPDRSHLHVVPMTCSIEMMAEVASLLKPGMRVVGAKAIQVGKWIDVRRNGPPVVLSITATLLAGGGEARVAVRRHAGEQAGVRTGPAVAEATIVFAPGFPTAPSSGPEELMEARSARTTAAGLYTEHYMFHGPRFQGVVGLGGVGRNGMDAELEVLPTHDVLSSRKAPSFFIDPFLLDAAGQLVAYWAIECLDQGVNMFPIQVRELTLYQPNAAVGRKARCTMRIREASARNLRADLDIFGPDGRLWMRVIGWTDWRFYWPASCFEFARYPNRAIVSEPIAVVLPRGFEDVECRRLSYAGEIGTNIWEQLSAHLMLCERELGEFWVMPEGARRKQFVFSRAVAKDAIRAWVKRRHALDLYPADIDIRQDELGRPIVHGNWITGIGETPQVSISHKADLAVAAAGSRVVGIDLESVAPREVGFDTLAFDDGERQLLGDFNGDRDEWVTRAWCAKEAAGKASGRGLNGDPKTMTVHRIDAGRGELLVRGCPSGGASGKSEYVVRSVRDGQFVVAVAVEERNGHDDA